MFKQIHDNSFPCGAGSGVYKRNFARNGRRSRSLALYRCFASGFVDTLSSRDDYDKKVNAFLRLSARRHWSSPLADS